MGISKDTCYAKIGSSKNDFWLLGIAFLQLYYSLYDMERNQIGLVVNKYSTEIVAVEDLGDRKIIIIVTIAIGIAANAVISIFAYRNSTKDETKFNYNNQLHRVEVA